MNQRPGKGRRQQKQQFQPATAREVAFAVLNCYRESGDFVASQLDRECTAAALSPQDRGLAVELTHGVVRRQATLDAIITPCVSRSRDRVEPELWTLLQLGAYQLLLLSSIPAHAAVNETVGLAARFGKRQWTGLLNGVLRAIGRITSDETVNAAAVDAVPLADGQFRRLSKPAFPDPSSDWPAYLSVAFSYPRWLIDRWSDRFAATDVERLAFWFNAPSPLYLRVNRLRAERQQVLDDLNAAGIEATAGRLPESIRLEARTRFGNLEGAKRGLYTLQDESAMSAVNLLDPQPGETVLDLCAAPGTKTTHIAERMGNTGRVVATDVQQDRLMRVIQNCERLGISIVEPTPIERDGKGIPKGPFDAILIDAPCSNTGVLGKRPEARWRLSEKDLEELPELQTRLLRQATRRLKPGGRIVYSTCSIEPEENRAVVSAMTDLQLIEEHQHMPGEPADGGYQALLRK